MIRAREGEARVRRGEFEITRGQHFLAVTQRYDWQATTSHGETERIGEKIQRRVQGSDMKGRQMQSVEGEGGVFIHFCRAADMCHGWVSETVQGTRTLRHGRRKKAVARSVVVFQILVWPGLQGR
ncbi:hypothetical protein EJ04DRAFT_58216 [Polyplosphaeria fusca]|uniref:Uncharacterized protein n=1 Tax=Polyplosphaeria fusca TaxID=682080 RepID=A0A9P4UYB9_9PLEO|nr:hypothetical protein EJ04DRAFT_58216 [Polyplosphaeria fusca]